MASVAAASSASSATADDVLHLLFNQADGILAYEQPSLSSIAPCEILCDSAFDILPDLTQQPEPSPPDSQGSGGSGSFAGCSSAGSSGEDLLPFDLDSFLSGAEALGHASYELGPPPEAPDQSAGPLRGGSGGSGGGKRRKRQLAQLPYSIGDLEDDDLALYGGGGIWDDADDDDGTDGGGGGGQLEGRPGEPLLLTAEEQRVARQLGATLPSHFPLTRDEMRIVRTVRRKIRNKISAKNSRAKKQEYVRGLELRVKGSAVENAALRDRCAGLEQQNRRLLGAVRRLQAFMRCSGLSLTSTAGKATGTGLFILCLSFALFLTPQLGPLLAAGPGAGVDPATAAARPATGRRILAASPEVASTGNVAERAATDPGVGKEAIDDKISATANKSASVVEVAVADDSDSVASSSPPVSPQSLSSSSSPAQSPYYYYGDDDAPPREQDLADRDL